MLQLNFDKRISEIERIITMYGVPNKSLTGRLTVMLLPKLVYLLTVLPTPPNNIFDVIEIVNDLLSHSGDRLGYHDFMERYQIKINFLDFYSLTHSIPRHLLKNCKTKLNEGHMKQSFLQNFVQKKHTSKYNRDIFERFSILNFDQINSD